VDPKRGGVVSEAKHVERPVGLRRFKPYPAYRDSGVEWLGRIPAHWETKRLKYVAPVTDERSQGVTSDLPYIGLEHIESGTGRLVGTSDNVSAEDGEAEGAGSIFQPGDVLFGKLRPYLAKVFRPEAEGCCSTELLVLRTAGDILPSVLAYQLLSRGFIGWVDAMTYGTKMPRANPGQVMNIPVALCSPEEQRDIAAFLDRETGKIDALAAKKERLIELLQEKRTALITQAVTRGLDPNVPMRDSGVDWLGEIPAHWKTKRLKHLASVNPESLGEDTDPGRNMVYVDIGGVDSLGQIVERELFTFAAAPSRARRLVREGDVILSTVRTYLRAIAPMKNPEHNLVVSTGFAVVRPADDLTTGFAACALRAPYFVERVVANSKGVSFPAINETEMATYELAVPPEPEQRAIAAFLERETAKIDALIAKVREGIERLKECRAALISAAVTGKIDVREEAA
jgi:type I restriction enzyme, S subunit